MWLKSNQNIGEQYIKNDDGMLRVWKTWFQILESVNWYQIFGDCFKNNIIPKSYEYHIYTKVMTVSWQYHTNFVFVTRT